jgi:hypothetical protein
MNCRSSSIRRRSSQCAAVTRSASSRGVENVSIDLVVVVSSVSPCFVRLAI